MSEAENERHEVDEHVEVDWTEKVQAKRKGEFDDDDEMQTDQQGDGPLVNHVIFKNRTDDCTLEQRKHKEAVASASNMEGAAGQENQVCDFGSNKDDIQKQRQALHRKMSLLEENVLLEVLHEYVSLRLILMKDGYRCVHGSSVLTENNCRHCLKTVCFTKQSSLT